MNTEYRFEGRTAEEWRAAAARSRKASADSWERSDTDGFLSQWASDTIAREYDLKARIAEQSGRSTFQALFDLEGNRVFAQYVETKFGWAWRIFDRETKETLGWFNESNARSEETRKANNAKKGYYVGTVEADCKVVSGGNRINVSYYPIPVDKYLIDATVVDSGK